MTVGHSALMHQFLISLPGPTDNTPVLRALEYGVIILLWLFFMWVVRAVWVEVRPLKRRKRRRGEDTEVSTATGRKERKGRVLRLHVIRPEDQARIFQRFERAVSAASALLVVPGECIAARKAG